jgi:hypothetical protein
VEQALPDDVHEVHVILRKFLLSKKITFGVKATSRNWGVAKKLEI